MNLLGTIGVVKTEEALIKNDCPMNCDTTHCDECPFRAKEASKDDKK